MADYSDKDYDQIEAAVLNTARGRWFLGEYARRHRAADTETLLEAISRLERGIGLHVQGGIPAPALAEIEDIAKSITVAKQEIASLVSDIREEIAARKATGALALLNFAEERLDGLLTAHVRRVEEAIADPVAAPAESEPEPEPAHPARVVVMRPPAGEASAEPEPAEPEPAAVDKPRILVVRRGSGETRIPLVEDDAPETPPAETSSGT